MIKGVAGREIWGRQIKIAIAYDHLHCRIQLKRCPQLFSCINKLIFMLVILPGLIQTDQDLIMAIELHTQVATNIII